MAIWSNLAGSVLGYIRLGLTGPRLKNSAGELAVRNAGDTADAKVQIADGTAANHAVSKGQLDTKQPLDDQLTTLAGITAQQATDLASLSTFMGTVLNDADAATARATLGISSSAVIDSWPVGSVFIAVVATNPNTLLGGGTWAAFGAGRVMVGFDSTQTEFDVVEETGGAKTHTLTTSEIPAHTHSINVPGVGGNSIVTSGGSEDFVASTTGATGGGGAHNNLQPYIVCYFWKRTA